VLGAILYATTPLVAWEATTAYVDVASACYGLLIVVATWQWLVIKHRGWLLLTGLLSGFALSTKLNAVFLLAPLAVFITIAIFAERSQTLKQRFLSLASFCTMGLLSSAPWPVLRYVQTGNPVFPLLNNVFKSPLWPEVNEHFNWAMFGIGTGLDSFFRLPWEMTFQGTSFAETHQMGMIGLGLLVLPVLIFGRIFGRSASRLVVFVGITLLVFSICWAYSVQYLRYFLIVLPLVYILAGYALVRIKDFSPASSIQGIVTALIYGLIWIWIVVSLLFYTSVVGNAPYKVAFGLESRQEYLARTLSTYSAFEHIDQVYGKYAHILSLNDDGNRLYSSGIVEIPFSPPTDPLWDTLLHTSSYEGAANVLKQHGITHLLIKDVAPSNIQSIPIVQKAFLDEYASLEYARNEVEVYRILRDDERSGRETKPVVVH
jgi:hypothetical protein